MSNHGKRSYSSTLRDSQARQTRREIVAAAGRLFAAQGFAATTIDAIAADAGVSRKTVFTSVGGKVALLRLAYDYAMAGDDEPVPMIAREGLQAIIAEPDPYAQMRMFAEFVTGMGERISALWLALRGAAEVDPEARDLYQRWDRQRLDSMRDGPVRDLQAKGALRADVSPKEAAAIFWLLIDPELYHRLVVVQGWTRKRFRDWLYETFVSQLLTPPPPGRGHSVDRGSR
jgi:AcrR family transcriptional regulator